MKNDKQTDNPNAFKHWINDLVVQKIGRSLKKVQAQFNQDEFVKVGSELSDRELKQRVLLIRERLYQTLPKDAKQAISILIKSIETSDLKGFELWPYSEYLQLHGLQDPELSLKALYLLTQKFTAEFAIRSFLQQYPKGTYATLRKWTADPSVHVRRLTSEGTRPRLPWGIRLHQAVQNPKPGINILKCLIYDDELYVRKSIANHLNDIAKDHPKLVVETLKQWLAQCPQKHLPKLLWIQSHALRSLVKKGNPLALKQLGFGKTPSVQLSQLTLNKKTFNHQDILKFEFQMTSKSTKIQKLAVDYVINFVKANGQSSHKVFKLKVLKLLPGQQLNIAKNHSLRPVSTRKMYSGQHSISLQINGKLFDPVKWNFRT